MRSWFDRLMVVIGDPRRSSSSLKSFHWGYHGIESGSDTIAPFLPLQIQHGHQRLGHGRRPAIPQFDGILLGDHYVIGSASSVSQPGNIFIAVVVMVLPGGNLHGGTGSL